MSEEEDIPLSDLLNLANASHVYILISPMTGFYTSVSDLIGVFLTLEVRHGI